MKKLMLSILFLIGLTQQCYSFGSNLNLNVKTKCVFVASTALTILALCSKEHIKYTFSTANLLLSFLSLRDKYFKKDLSKILKKYADVTLKDGDVEILENFSLALIAILAPYSLHKYLSANNC